ncbi:CAP domain-containing protein [Nonomuraea dietziae]|uniref:CAP domain-containing protein n=1 Tax=Nonomuraea dietziae TaxID=65515 RepID=UPI0031D0C543
MEEEVVKLTNEARATSGCKPLTHDPKLHAAAEGHSADMAAKGYFDHTSPDGRNPGDRIKASGFSPISAWGENIAKGQRTAADVVRGWHEQPGAQGQHHELQLHPHRGRPRRQGPALDPGLRPPLIPTG